MADKLGVNAFIAIVDSRESLPYCMSPMGQQTEALAAGDYSVLGLTDLIAVERKSLSDFTACCGPERLRFMPEMQRLKAYRFRCVVCEFSWADVEKGNYRSRISAKALAHSIISWQSKYALPFAMVGNRAAGERYTIQFLYRSALRVWERGAVFRETIKQETGAGHA